MKRVIVSALLCGLAMAMAQEPQTTAPAPAEPRAFIRPVVLEAKFTPDKTALLESECERIATFLARYAAQQYSAGVLRGEAQAQTQGKLLLAVSLHLHPLNPSAVHCSNRWLDRKEPTLPPPGEDLRIFSNFLVSAARRQSDKVTPARETLARVLNRLAADLDPGNEDAIYASELQDRAGKTPPLKELLEGTLGKGW